ncbi:unnamed protein product [Colias eurytheme]|nr:unnamed protein product [Colias eurytheme]
MDDDKYALVEKIVKDIHNVLSKTAELYAFDIVPVDSNFRNKSPVLCVENCLGLESWCVKHVYMYCYSEIRDKFGMNSQRKHKKITTLDSERLVKLLNATLLINPDVTTLWNKRREIVQILLLDKVSELQFSQLVLSRKPKCNDAFAYRRWLLGALLLSDNVQPNSLENLINSELRICDETSDKSPNNYHSWSHRLWVVNNMKNVLKQFDMNSLYIKDLNDMRQKQAKISRYDSNCIYNSVLFQVILNHENKFIEERQTDGDNYAGRHEKYLKFVEGLNNVM